MAEQFTEEDLDDFMEVVMTYKCKFCTYTANSTQDMGYHVRSTHKKLPDRPQGTQTADSNLQVSNTGNSLTLETSPILDNTPSSSQMVDETFDSNVPSGKDELNKTVNRTDLIESNNQLDSLQADVLTMADSTQVYNEEGQVLNEGVQMSNIQFINQNADGMYILQDGQNVQFDNGSTVQVLVQDSDFDAHAQGNTAFHAHVQGNTEFHAHAQSNTAFHAYAQDRSVDKDFLEQVVDKTKELQSFDREDNLQYVIEDSAMKIETEVEADQYAIEVQTEDDNFAQSEEQPPLQTEDCEQTELAGPDQDNGGQREVELFLCGSCRQGFTTIQDCKAHLTQEHGFSDTTNNTKVDAGTQMEPRKKVGRKKKSEVAAAAKEDVVEKVRLSDSDEDWSEKLEMYGPSARSHRRRQPPRSLRLDFYLGSSKKKVPKKREDPGLNVKCTVKGCTGKFKDEEAQQQHFASHIMDAKSSEHQFRCLICTDKFFTWKQARYHMWKIHKLDMGLLTCQICHVFKTDTMSKLKIHQEIHGVERPYVCEICGKAFKQAAQMKNHEALHEEFKRDCAKSGEDQKWHMPKTCDICERTFANAKCLKIHKEALHTQIKRFKCRFCDHECARKAMLILHERTHTGEKPFKCDICHYSCGDHNSLRRHKMRHTGQKPYKCPHCPYACIQAISLKVHVKNKHPGMSGVYNCSMCLYRTVNMQQYENHLKDHKNGLIEKTVENAADGQTAVKINNKQRKSKSMLEKEEVSVTYPQGMVVPGFPAQTVPMQNMSLPQLVQMPASSVTSIRQSEPLEMQIEMKEDGNHIISSEDLSKLTNYDGLVQSDMAAAQLIYSALSAISQNSQGDNSQVVAGVQNGDIQTSIETDSSQGVTTHTITFHLPESEEIVGQENIAGQAKNDPGLTVIQVDGTGQ